MSGENQHCAICNRSIRGSKNLYMTIKINDQEDRIKQGYFRRWKKELSGSMIGKSIHVTCYRSVVRHEPTAIVRVSSGSNKSNRKSNKKPPPNALSIVESLDSPCLNPDDQRNFDQSTSISSDIVINVGDSLIDCSDDAENDFVQDDFISSQQQLSFEAPTFPTSPNHVPFNDITNKSFEHSHSIESMNSSFSFDNWNNERSTSTVRNTVTQHRRSRRVSKSTHGFRRRPHRRSVNRIFSPNTSFRVNYSDSVCDPGVRLFDTGFDELCPWMFNLLCDGFLRHNQCFSIEYSIVVDIQDTSTKNTISEAFSTSIN